MKRSSLILLLATVVAAQAADNDGFVPLFNGRDLTGWVNANCAPETWSVRDGLIHCTGQPTGALRTERQYENFILEVEFKVDIFHPKEGVYRPLSQVSPVVAALAKTQFDDYVKRVRIFAAPELARELAGRGEFTAWLTEAARS